MSRNTITYEEFEKMLGILSNEQQYILDSLGIRESLDNYENDVAEALKTMDYRKVKKIINDYNVVQEKVQSSGINFIVDCKTVLRKGCYAKGVIDLVVYNINRKRLDVVDDIIGTGLEETIIRNDALIELLKYAMIHQDHKVMKYLLDNGYDINQKDKNQKTPLMSAMGSKSWSLSKYLIESGGADVNDGYSLHVAVEYGNIDMVEYFIRHGADVNMPDASTGYTPLVIAMYKDNNDMIKYLIKNKVDVDLCDMTGRTALMASAKIGYIRIVKHLIENKASLDMQDDCGKTALIYAAEQGNFDIVKELIASGANMNICDNDGVNVLRAAAKEGHLEIVYYIIEHETDVDARNAQCFDALMYASGAGHIKILEYFMTSKYNGYDINQKSAQGITALMYASSLKQVDVVKYLLEHGSMAIIDDEDCTHTTALIEGVDANSIEIVKCLVEHGASVSNHNAMVALMRAERYGYTEIIEYLEWCMGYNVLLGKVGESLESG